jgi:hypothetical protein
MVRGYIIGSDHFWLTRLAADQGYTEDDYFYMEEEEEGGAGDGKADVQDDRKQ